MEKIHLSGEEKKAGSRIPKNKQAVDDARPGKEAKDSLASLQHQVGNRAVQRIVAQRSGEGPFELDEETAGRITRERSNSQPLDKAAQESMSAATGNDFSDVRVHTSPESDTLNQELGAKAFTTGKDIFFREGEYDPHSSSGQLLLAHELTHVVQQRSGAVGNGGRMTVNAPGDAFEQEADSVSKTVTSPGSPAGLQRAADEEEEIQMKEEEEEEVQMQEEEEEEPVQMQELEEDEQETM